VILKFVTKMSFPSPLSRRWIPHQEQNDKMIYFFKICCFR